MGIRSDKHEAEYRDFRGRSYVGVQMTDPKDAPQRVAEDLRPIEHRVTAHEERLRACTARELYLKAATCRPCLKAYEDAALIICETLAEAGAEKEGDGRQRMSSAKSSKLQLSPSTNAMSVV